MKRGDITKPFLKWVGGKGRVIPQLEQFFPTNFNNYFEPFVGGGAVYFYLGSKKSTINDINKNLIGAYINIRDNVESLIKELSILKEKYMSLGSDLQKNMYYEIRDEFNNIADYGSVRKSALLIFLNKTCFNGMYRENRNGKFNVPFNASVNPPICDENGLHAASMRLTGTNIVSGSYDAALKNAKRDDFIYIDPPYYPLNSTSSFTSYTEGDFTEQDQIKLKKMFDDLSSRGCKVMMSNSYTKFIINLYKDYKQHKIYVGRAINSNGKKRGKIAEIVVTNY